MRYFWNQVVTALAALAMTLFCLLLLVLATWCAGGLEPAVVAPPIPVGWRACFTVAFMVAFAVIPWQLAPWFRQRETT